MFMDGRGRGNGSSSGKLHSRSLFKRVIICSLPHAGCVSPLSVFLYHGKL